MRTRSPIQTAAMLAGIVFLLVGILGFIPGITTHYSDLKFAGHGSDAKLLGLFNVSVLHNIVHLLFGVAGVALAKTWQSAKAYLLYGGLIYLVLFVYGVIWHGNSSANFVPVNWADNILHLGLGIGMISLGVVLGKETVRRELPVTA
jgi:hypothetical protein